MRFKRRYNFVIDNKLKNLSERIIILFSVGIIYCRPSHDNKIFLMTINIS